MFNNMNNNIKQKVMYMYISVSEESKYECTAG